MKNWMNEVLNILKGILTLLTEIRLKEQEKAYRQRTMLNKYEVMVLLQITDTTYRHCVKKRLLIPTHIHSIDMYNVEDLQGALEESRRKGRF